MKRLYIASHQLPVGIKKTRNGFHVEPGDEMERSGLKEFYRSFNTCWIGLTGVENYQFARKEMQHLKEHLWSNFRCIPVFPDPSDCNKYFHGFAKQTLWPLFHYFTQNASYQNDHWKSYKNVNSLYASKICKFVSEDEILWIHDYHLTLLPKMIRAQKPGVSVGIFVHIPFPSFEIFRLLPWRAEVLEGLVGADLIGFQTYDDVRHFLSCVRRILGHDTIFNQIRIGDRILKVDAFPRGIDFDKFMNGARECQEKPEESKSGISREADSYLKQNEGKKLIFSEGRLDYTKGMVQQLMAYEMLLQKFPMYLEKVLMILIAVPTGETGGIYDELKRQVDELVGRINGNFGTINWMPVWYLNRSFTIQELNELYALSDIALIIPLRDGMNLIAKRYIASRPDGKGVLILSEMAGASKELHESIIVNPNNLEEVVNGLGQAMEMPEEEQIRRNRIMQERLKRYNVDRWAREFIKGLEGVKEIQQTTLTKKITGNHMEQISRTFIKAANRILFLDYDGTLTWFKKDPEDAKPDKVLYRLLKKLSTDKRNTLVIISGRDKETLGRWFDPAWKIHFIAEHGVWLRDPGSDWHMMEQIDNEWKESIRPLLEFYVDQTPRSFIENKNFSLVWHYRNADPDLGIQRAWELKDALHIFTSNLNLEIMDGDKVLEIKYSGINKGKAALSKLGDSDTEFILAIGDDWTDEYTFDALPERACTIKVGTKTTKAQYYIESVDQVRELLGMFIE
ncbi:MAG: bifunctional alpha,alpha-trehalose-phosphate synthase (UDP-forming)/trehalose-phosphatase [Bacteroidales bacterium]|nr:MAG: bifunctional alpha,alpha-trehalose-phosphate synthase (UDP-forming)/trehalose-phosphatase [Bacteroidales bacterium]